MAYESRPFWFCNMIFREKELLSLSYFKVGQQIVFII